MEALPLPLAEALPEAEPGFLDETLADLEDVGGFWDGALDRAGSFTVGEEGCPEDLEGYEIREAGRLTRACVDPADAEIGAERCNSPSDWGAGERGEA